MQEYVMCYMMRTMPDTRQHVDTADQLHSDDGLHVLILPRWPSRCLADSCVVRTAVVTSS